MSRCQRYHRPFSKPRTRSSTVDDRIVTVTQPTFVELVRQGTVVQVATPGPQGPPGPQGEPGAQGPPGASAIAGATRVTVTAPAATVLSGHRAVRPRPDGTVAYADATDAAHLHGPLWVTIGAAAAGALVEMVTYGPLVEPSWAWTPGLPVFLAVAGALTQTPLSGPPFLFVTRVGVATAPGTLFVDPHPPIALIA